MLKLDYSWVTEPPITVFTGEAANPHITRIGTRLLDQIRAYRAGLPSPDLLESSESTDSADIPVDPDRVPSLEPDNIDNAETMCSSILKSSFVADEVFCVYKLGSDPIALMILMPLTNEILISKMVVHPGAASGGSIMIEFAVNFCAKVDVRPYISLYALNETSIGAYKAVGFESEAEDANSMFLDLTKKLKKWAYLEGKWRYTSSGSPGLKYAKLAPSVPNSPKPRR